MWNMVLGDFGLGGVSTSLHAQLCGGDLLLLFASAFSIFSLLLLLFLWGCQYLDRWE